MSILNRFLSCLSIFSFFVASLLSSQAAAHRMGRGLATGDEPVFRYHLTLKNARPSQVRDVVRFLARGDLDIAGVDYPERRIELLVTESEIEWIEKRLPVRGERIGTLQAERVDPRYLTPDEVEQRLRELATSYPQLARLHEIGRTHQNRPVLALEISTPGPTVKPSLLVDGLHHAREVMTPEVPLAVADFLLKGATQRAAPPRVRKASRDLIDRARVWIVPMLNPDGSHLVWTQNAWWRKNARAENGRVFGVDLNRNYPFQWGACNGSSGSKSSDTYRGHEPGSEPEIQSVLRLADQIRPVGHLSFHSYGEMVIYPFSCQGQKTSERELFEAVGRKLAQSIPRDSGRGSYTAGYGWELLYPTDGDANDHYYSSYGTISMTLEINTAFEPSYELRDPTIQKLRPAILGFMEDMLQNTLTVKTMDQRGSPVPARVEFAEITHQHGERALTTDVTGTLFKVLAVGDYRVRVTTSDGRRQETTLKMSGQPQIIEVRL